MYLRELDALVREMSAPDAAPAPKRGLRAFVRRNESRLEIAVACMVVVCGIVADAWAICSLFLDKA